jgi:dTDP-4-amino-4,6-dideoxygalactose transaminase
LQAALGISQLQRLNAYVERRHKLAKRYEELLRSTSVVLPWQHPDSYSAMHLYIIRLKLERINKNRRQVFEELHALGIGVSLHYIPVHTHPYYQKMGFKLGDFPQSEQYYSEAISLPMFQTLSYDQQDNVVEKLHKVLTS